MPPLNFTTFTCHKTGMRFIRVSIFFLLLVNVSMACAQGDSLNRQKYWCLRERLITKFVKPGLGPGESLPANKYTIGISWMTSPASLVKKLEWGDGTINLGWYIGVLATELELLQREEKTRNVYFQRLVEEIYFALNAFNRLDDEAEIVWGYAPADCATRIDKVEPVLWDSINQVWLPKPGSGDQPMRNGFFLRNDGNTNLLEYFTDATSICTEMVRPWVWRDTMSLSKTGDNFASFGFYYSDPREKGFEYRANGYYPANETSQDQIFNMLMGLTLTFEFVEEDIHYKGISIKLMAKEIALRMLSNYKGTEFRNTMRPGRPVCSAGGNSFAFWQSIKKMRRYFETGKKNQVKDQILFWGKLDCNTSSEVNRALFVVIAAIANSTPQQDLCRYATGDGFNWGFYYLLRRAIYNPPILTKGGCVYTLEQAKLELDACPFRGPHMDLFEYGEDGNYMADRNSKKQNFKEYTKQEIIDHREPLWHLTNRFFHVCTPQSADQKRFIVNQGEFNGLDYLLFYNLCHLVFGSEAMGGSYSKTRNIYFRELEEY